MQWKEMAEVRPTVGPRGGPGDVLECVHVLLLLLLLLLQLRLLALLHKRVAATPCTERMFNKLIVCFLQQNRWGKKRK